MKGKESRLNSKKNQPWHIPHVGQRMVKTAVAVFCCLLIYRLLGYEGESMPTEACITTIICMQPLVTDSREFALNRFAGTMIGAIWGLLLLLLLYAIPALGKNFVVLYGLMALGVLVSVYTGVALKIPEVSGLSAIIFICIVVRFPDIDAPHIQVAQRLLGVLIGTTVAITVNLVRLPREKNKNTVFFVRAKDLIPDRFSQLPPAAHFQLNRFYEDGAKICIMSEHAPAMFTMQMSSCQLNVPMIVMDGAAIYDTEENQYLYIETLPTESSAWLQRWFRERGYSFYTYIIRKNRTCIFHEGCLHSQEEALIRRLRRSPYRSYLDGGDFHPEEIVYFKVVAQNQTLVDLEKTLAPLLAKHGLRSAIRNQAKEPNIDALYIYSAEATPAHAQEFLMERLRKDNPELRAKDLFLAKGYRSEHDVIVLMRRIRSAYEPVRFLHRRTDKAACR